MKTNNTNNEYKIAYINQAPKKIDWTSMLPATVLYDNNAILGMGKTYELALADAKKFINPEDIYSDIGRAVASPELEARVNEIGGNIAFTVKEGVAYLA